MKRQSYQFLLLITIFLITAGLSSNDQLIDMIDQLERYYENNNQEKIYVHLDRKIYQPGDDIWFKAYILESSLRNPSESAKLDIALISNSSEVILEKETTAFKGIAFGNLTLPDSIDNGSYSIAVKTERSETEDIYTKSILVESFSVNETKAKEVLQSQPESINLQFFPEGGQLIKGLENNVAFKATDALGRPVDFEGNLVHTNGKSEPVVSFYQGMGSFKYTPSNEPAKLVLTSGDNKGLEFTLPPAIVSGFAIQVNKNEEELIVQFRSNRNKTEQVFVLFEVREELFWASTEEFDSEFTLPIPLEEVPTGVGKLTVFNVENSLIQERLIFIKGNDILELESEVDKDVATRRDKVTISLSAMNLEDFEIGNFSLSIVDERLSYDRDRNSPGILASLLLQSDLRGTIPTPNYYFENKSSVAQKALDLVMMIHGWRRYSWQEVQNFADYEVNAPTKSISGTVAPQYGKPSSQYDIQLVNPSDFNVILETKTDDQGYFVFEDIPFVDFGSALWVMASSQKKKEKLKVILDDQSSWAMQVDPRIETKSKVSLSVPKSQTGQSLSSNEWNTMTDLTGIKILQELVIEGKSVDDLRIRAKPMIDDQYSFKKNQDQLRVRAGNNPMDMITQVAPTVRISNGRLSFRSDPTFSSTSGNSGAALIVIDDAPMGYSTNWITGLSALQIESIQVIRGATAGAAYGYAALGGVIKIETKSYSALYQTEITEDDFCCPMATVPIISWNKEFYSPMYDSDTARANATPDLRKTLFWTPNIKLESGQKTSLEFYAGDRSAHFVGIIEGMTDERKIGQSRFYFEVR